MRRALKLAVVSDHHIDTAVAPDSWDLARVVFKKVAAAKVDHVVIAGDLFDCATAMLRDRDQLKKQLGGKVPVYLMGRSGGVHQTIPVFGVLNVPRNGAVRWTECEV